jgi:hypothetical protein
MSNERIDLTQFEGIGKWEVEKQPDGSYAIKTGRDNFSLEEAETIVKLPELIAELKKCYERMDYHKCLLDELYSSKRISPSDILAIEQEVKREFYPELFHHGDGWEISGGPCECMKCQEDEASE